MKLISDPCDVKRLKTLVSALRICTLIGVVLIPAMVVFTPEAFFGSVGEKLLHLLGIQMLPTEQAELYVPVWWTFGMVVTAWGEVWSRWEWIVQMAVMMVCAVGLLLVLNRVKDNLEVTLHDTNEEE